MTSLGAARSLAAPIVKWAGGKTRQLPLLVPMVPASLRVYAEPFVGGGAMFFALAEQTAAGERRIDRFVLGDTNPDLIVTYRAIADSPASVIEALSGYRNTPEDFARARALQAPQMPDVERAARTLYLNRTCFNGLWRTNLAGQFNAPFGKYKNPRLVHEDRLHAVSRVLRSLAVEIVCADFTETMGRLGQGDFAFLDPPYDAKDDGGSFTTYTAGGFGRMDQARVMAAMRALRTRGGHALMTNHDTRGVRSLAHGLFVRGITAPRAIAANGSRAPAREVVVRTWR